MLLPHGAQTEGLASRNGVLKVPWTTIAMIFVGSYFEVLYQNYREPTTKMVLVVEGRFGVGCDAHSTIVGLTWKLIMTLI